MAVPMLRFNIRVDQAKSRFFDRAAVMKDMDDKTRAFLSRAGAYVRRRASTSLRRRKKVSAPGDRPSVHSGDPFATLKNILFSWDPASRSVVVGPVRTNSKRMGNMTPPELLEFGGSVPGQGKTLYITQAAGRGAGGKFVSQGQKKVVLSGNMRYTPRPYMGPALAAEAPNFPRHWQAAVRST